jgi:hypothetical protein
MDSFGFGFSVDDKTKMSKDLLIQKHASIAKLALAQYSNIGDSN